MWIVLWRRYKERLVTKRGCSMFDEKLAWDVARELERRRYSRWPFRDIRRMYMRDIIVGVLHDNGYAVPSNEWLERAIEFCLPLLDE
jgi:hypothetical protein